VDDIGRGVGLAIRRPMLFSLDNYDLGHLIQYSDLEFELRQEGSFFRMALQACVAGQLKPATWGRLKSGQ
jgi:hypothetical protein